ncbi:HNH endonuclease signature motif containing protein [Tenacibaculum finnmarkense]|uniref:HNH endonuclease signature motif containing protein n=1 Tax=Tenacibaculum finnmarkense TaxID=2781243 RepID=UPI001EFA3A9F|nr:HNH endonuclease signature motif containing protein [Tenacibaculum finnmarkense]
MRKEGISIWHIVLVLFFTIMYCNYYGDMGDAFPAFCVSCLIWGFLCFVFDYLKDKYSDLKNEDRERKENRRKHSKLLIGLKINKTQWKEFSDSKREKYRNYYFKLEKIKEEIIYKRYWKNELAKDIIKKEFEKELELLSLQQIIELIEKDELEKESKRLDKERKHNEEINRFNVEVEQFKKKQKNIKRKNDIKLKIQQTEENEIKLRKERKLAKEKEETERNLKQIEEQKKEEQKRIEEIKRKKIIEERKKQEKERYKEYYKGQQREKEERKKWASEAIEEMIKSGEIDGNVSSDRKRTISSNVKEIVYVRDKGCCVTCGSKENIEYDHVIPFSKGGSNSVNNIQLLCLKCNRSKSNKIM